MLIINNILKNITRNSKFCKMTNGYAITMNSIIVFANDPQNTAGIDKKGIEVPILNKNNAPQTGK